MTFFASISTLLVTTVTIGEERIPTYTVGHYKATSGLYSGLETEMFTAGEMFTALALFNQLAVCLSVFPVTLPILIKGLVSRNRQATFLSRLSINYS